MRKDGRLKKVATQFLAFMHKMRVLRLERSGQHGRPAGNRKRTEKKSRESGGVAEGVGKAGGREAGQVEVGEEAEESTVGR